MDRALVERARHGDREAFGALVQAHVDWMFALAYRIVRDYDRAEDAVQQTLLHVWRDLPQLRDADRLLAWMRRVLVRVCVREASRARLDAVNIRVLPPVRSYPDDSGRIADRDELNRGFRRLPADQRAILVLHYYLGMQLAEVARTLGIPPGTARSRLFYAQRAMRAALEAEGRTTSQARAGR
jgi:RNA polymerase sigma-70 factor (ECF subfamily)